MALVKYNNNSISSVTALDSIASGDINLITTNTISSGVSSSSFTSNIDSTYDTYLFKFINIHPATDNVNLTVNFRDGGSDFDATKTTSYFHAYHDEADSGTSVGENTSNDIAQGTGYQMIGHIPGNDNDQSVSGTLYLFSPASTTFVKHFLCIMNSSAVTPATYNDFVGGYFNTTTAITRFQFKMSTGNIDSGTIKLYGIKGS